MGLIVWEQKTTVLKQLWKYFIFGNNTKIEEPNKLEELKPVKPQDCKKSKAWATWLANN